MFAKFRRANIRLHGYTVHQKYPTLYFPANAHNIKKRTCEACVLCTHASQLVICSHNTEKFLYELYVSTLNQVCNFSWVLAVAPWWWFSCKPKYVGAVFLILKCFNNSTFVNVVCISWKIKCYQLLASSRLSVLTKQLGIHWMDFREIWYLSIFRKTVKNIQVQLKSEKNNG